MWVIDLDGVVWKGKEPIWDNVEALKKLKGEKVFLTNNSTRARWEVEERLKELGLEGKVITSGYVASKFLKRKGIAKVLPVGEAGLCEELVEAGLRLTYDPEKAEAVVVGLDRSADYWKLSLASKAIARGALFVATNEDKTFPTEEGLYPGAGALVEFLKTSTGREPVVVGKPSKTMLEEATGGRKAIVVGDRLETDIKMALDAGMEAILVLTGVTKEVKEIPPGVRVVRTLKELMM